MDLPPDLRAALSADAHTFVEFTDIDSGCAACGVEAEGRRLFVKWPINERGRDGQLRAVAVHARVRHPNLVPILRTVPTRSGPTLIYPWIDGEGLRKSDLMMRLPLPRVLEAIETVIEIHALIEAAGFVSIDLYDGNLLYADRIYVIDVDEYRPAPYVREDERPLGSRRFMAPEEFVPGATLDARTMVFHLGRAIAVLLDPPEGRSVGRSPQVEPLIERATSKEPAARFQSVAEMLGAWRALSAFKPPA